jgi:large subunit ribosomal protein L18
MKNKREILRQKRHRTIRLKLSGDSLKPRLVLFRSLNNIFAELIDDTQNKTIFSLSTLNKEIKDKCKNAGNLKSAVLFGEFFALRAKEKGIKKIVFDRSGYLYHGRIKAFADSLRKGGLEF